MTNKLILITRLELNPEVTSNFAVCQETAGFL